MAPPEVPLAPEAASCQGVLSGSIRVAMTSRMNYINPNIKDLPFEHTLLQCSSGRSEKEGCRGLVVPEGPPLCGASASCCQIPKEG